MFSLYLRESTLWLCQNCLPIREFFLGKFFRFLTANEILFICLGKYGLVPTTFTKNTTEIRNNPSEKADAAKTGSVTQAREKGPGDLQN